jgi:hypothetical protein
VGGAYLGESLHEASVVLHSACRVNQHHVHSLLFGCGCETSGSARAAHLV